jgi:ABC-type cobalamin transport system permease subunit
LIIIACALRCWWRVGCRRKLCWRHRIASSLIIHDPLPRTVLALLTGRYWAFSGGAAGFHPQSFAEPALLGVSGGAALGRIAIYFGFAGCRLRRPLMGMWARAVR